MMSKPKKTVVINHRIEAKDRQYRVKFIVDSGGTLVVSNTGEPLLVAPRGTKVTDDAILKALEGDVDAEGD